MSSRHVLVVGSGPSGVHFAQTALEKGFAVTMVDVGRSAPAAILPDRRFDQLKDDLDDAVGYFLGSRYQGVLLPDFGREYYGIPPSKQYVFEDPAVFARSAEGFDPLFSFARGGLAQAWTAGCYPFNEAELADFPFDYTRIGAHYDEVAKRIGITGEADDLARFMPVHAHLLPPMPLDTHSALLARAYARKRGTINGRLGAYLGRTRVATLTRDMGDRHACANLGRCLWGCPQGSLYTPAHTLAELERTPGFSYLSGLEALSFRIGEGGRATALDARRIEGGERVTLPIDELALAAGALSTATLVLRSVHAATGERVRLTGLMDNRQVLVPFLNWRMLGRPYDPGAYQYHLLGMGLVQPDPREYVHAQITTLKTALMHPIIQQLPFDLRTSMLIARTTHSALGVVNVNLHDTRRQTNWVELEEDGGERARLRIHYVADPAESDRLPSVLKRIAQSLWQLGCILPPGMQHIRPMGASVHYAGLLPMTTQNEGRWTTDATGRSRAFPNVLVADGATFPFLPAKNLTFTLMANASRVASEALR
jgi:choline dehydrogenase-like flavoprotein